MNFNVYLITCAVVAVCRIVLTEVEVDSVARAHGLTSDEVELPCDFTVVAILLLNSCCVSSVMHMLLLFMMFIDWLSFL